MRHNAPSLVVMKKSASSNQNVKTKTAGGFGKTTSSSKSIGSKRGVLPSEDLAQRMLLESNGNVANAQSKFFNQKIIEMKNSEPQLYSEMQSVASKSSNGESESESSAQLRERLVEMTWDTVAAFLPKAGGTVDSVLEKKMIAIAQSCLHRPECSLLDVGCGTGSVLKFLDNSEYAAGEYHGIDISGNMIESAKSQHPGVLFEKTNFLQLPVGEGCKKYDTILFNGSIQFFVNQQEVIRRAKSLLHPAGRIVITHANGEEFVRQEQAGNRFLVPSLLPSTDFLEEVARKNGLVVMERNGTDSSLNDPASFYLQVLADSE